MSLKNKDLTKYIEHWVKTQKRDSKTFACILYVARKNLANGEIETAQKYYEDVFKNYWEDVLKGSVDELLNQDGGYISQTLGDLSDIYKQQGNLEKCEECQAELEKLLPKYNEAEQRVSVIPPKPRQQQFEPVKTRFTERIIKIVIINVVVIFISIFVTFRVIRKRYN
ncbi:MAG: hypothetical protein LBJ67_18545 [Planctomycetaceae bacterium]|nr:hypothetical protein [Planctomycetaceae bacterium]